MMRNIVAGGPYRLTWHKSSYSDADDMVESCVEVACAPGAVHVRDSKHTDGPQLAFPSTAWADFLAYAAKS